MRGIKGLERRGLGRALSTLLIISSLAGCSTLQGPELGVYDPLENVNRPSYRFSDAIDRRLLVPVARGYDKASPNWLQRGVLNMFANLRSVSSMVNGVLQAKPTSAATDFTRIVLNSTVGIGGFFDVAAKMDLQDQAEDFGQTLAVWGVKRSRFLYIPLIGPSTVRDLPSTVVRGLVPRLLLGGAYHWSVSVVDVVAQRADFLGASQARDASALDPYVFTRDAYYQRRAFQIYDGQPPLDDLFEDFEELDD